MEALGSMLRPQQIEAYLELHTLRFITVFLVLLFYFTGFRNHEQAC